MRATVRKWGNSLAIRIPRPVADELALEESIELDLRVENGKLVASPARRWTLEELVAGITAENQHDEVDWGERVGREVI
jgi:antitoxin MazE